MLFFGGDRVNVLLSVTELEETKNVLIRGVKDKDTVRIEGEAAMRSGEEIRLYAKAIEVAEVLAASIKSKGTINITVSRGVSVDELGERRKGLEAAKYFFELAKEPFNKDRLKFV